MKLRFSDAFRFPAIPIKHVDYEAVLFVHVRDLHRAIILQTRFSAPTDATLSKFRDVYFWFAPTLRMHAASLCIFTATRFTYRFIFAILGLSENTDLYPRDPPIYSSLNEHLRMINRLKSRNNCKYVRDRIRCDKSTFIHIKLCINKWRIQQLGGKKINNCVVKLWHFLSNICYILGYLNIITFKYYIFERRKFVWRQQINFI